MPYCVHCGGHLGGARYCAQCGARVAPGSGVNRTGGRRRDGASAQEVRHLGALAYLTPIPALYFLVFEPFGRHRFVRFHSYQCLLLTLAAFGLAALTGILSIWWLLESLVSVAIQVALLGAWALAAYKASRGETYRLPVIGTLAMQHAEGRR